MDIEGLGPAVIEQLVEEKLVQRLPDLYKLQAKDVELLERMGKKSAVNLIAGIEASKSRGMTRVLTGLGIRHVGRRAAEILAEHFGSMEKLLAADAEEIGSIHEIGPVMAESIVHYFHEHGGRAIIADLAEAGVRMDEPKAASRAAVDGPLVGKTCVVTGTLEKRTRDETHELIKAHGGKVATSVSAKTDYLIAGEKAGSKLTKAKQLGVAVLTEEQFEQLLAGRQDP
jgi:DNA ligase (NAD+)